MGKWKAGYLGNGWCLSDREDLKIPADVYVEIIVWNYFICSWYPGQQRKMLQK